MRHGLAVCATALVVPAGPLVRPGIEVLLEDSSHLIADRRVGLLTNQTGIDRSGTSDVQRLLDAGAQVTAVFAPEHGYRGALDQELIAHGHDSAAGLAVFSLYGEVRAPTPEMLQDVDVLLVDLQDIGGRPYTYILTTLRVTRSAAAEDVAVLVLDRPNPIGGTAVQGPILDTAFTSDVGMLPVAQRHGMTLGELARFGNEWLDIGADLTVIPADGWVRGLWFDQAGLPWVRPSPNMPDLESASHYPGLVLFEATNLSVGRGTPVAFQVIGAPWLDPLAVIARVGELEGVLLADTVIRPEAPPDGKYPDVTLPALRLLVTDRETYDPVTAAVALLEAIARLHGDVLEVRQRRLAQLIGTDRVWEAIREGASVEQIVVAWREPLERFREEREVYLLYR
jgi:beta-N-acetylhexosaminidase